MHEFLFSLKRIVSITTRWWKKFSHKIVVHLPSVYYRESLPKYLGPIWIMEFSFIGQKTGPGVFSHEKSSTVFRDLQCASYNAALIGVSLPTIGRACSLGCVLVHRHWRECLQVTVLWNLKILKFQALQKIKGYNLSLKGEVSPGFYTD